MPNTDDKIKLGHKMAFITTDLQADLIEMHARRRRKARRR